jgi:hypothetical protein
MRYQRPCLELAGISGIAINLASIVEALLRGGGGSIELEQMDSADTPLAVYSFHGGRHYQRRHCGTEEVRQQAGTIGSGHTCLALVHRLVFVRAAVCQQVAGIGRPHFSGGDQGAT